jgi:8-oxo-dGTP pyrophosphatase MutT (NUDIX family)
MTDNAEAKPSVTPVPAATLLVARDGPQGIEVLMVVRHDAAGFAAGAMVFPGGKVDAADRALLAHAANSDGISEEALAYRIAAIRETFEESGVLLARATRGASMLSAALLRDLVARHDTRDFAAFVKQTGLELATDLLVPFAHWITPKGGPRRFDTHFLLAPAPPDQIAAHDGREAVETRWITPAAAIEAGDQRKMKVVFPTRMNLAKLGRSRTVAEAIERARRAPIVTVSPEIVDTPQGQMLRIPAEAGYGLSEIPTSQIQRSL